jgi:hypothetical protein
MRDGEGVIVFARTVSVSRVPVSVGMIHEDIYVVLWLVNYLAL